MKQCKELEGSQKHTLWRTEKPVEDTARREPNAKSLA